MSGRMRLLIMQIRRKLEGGGELEDIFSQYLLTEAEKAELRAELIKEKQEGQNG